MKAIYKTADGFPSECLDLYSQDKNYPSFTIHGGAIKTESYGPDCEAWHDINVTSSSVTKDQAIALAKLHLGIDIEIQNF